MRGRGDRWFFAAALIVVLLGGGMAVFLATKTGDKATSVHELQSYHVEAVVTTPTASRQRLVRIWYQAPDRLRIETRFDGAPASVYVVDGAVMHVYDADNNTYYDTAKPDDVLQARGSSSTKLGPLPNQTLEGYFDALQGGTWDVAGQDKVLGKNTEIVERDLRTVAEGTLDRYWVDPRYLFVLRYESTTPNGKTTWEPTSVEYDAKIDPQLFNFEAPAGARKVKAPSYASPQTGPGGISSYTLPPGFLQPNYVPDGYQAAVLSQAMTSGGTGTSTRIIVRYNGAPTSGNASPYLIIEQTEGVGQEPPSGDKQVDVNGATAYVAEDGGVRTLSWQVPTSASSEGLSVELKSNALSADELLRIARSMH